LIAIFTPSLRFDTLNIALSHKDSSYCQWLFLLLIYFGKQNTTSIFGAVAENCKRLCFVFVFIFNLILFCFYFFSNFSFFIFFIFFIFLFFLFFFVNLVHMGEAFQHPMDHVHIAIVFITMLKIVLLPDNFLIILTSI
jgi:hypothetical protein